MIIKNIRSKLEINIVGKAYSLPTSYTQTFRVPCAPKDMIPEHRARCQFPESLSMSPYKNENIRISGQSNTAVMRVLLLHMDHLSLISIIRYGPPNPPGVVPEHLWMQPQEKTKQHKKIKYQSQHLVYSQLFCHSHKQIF